MKSLLITSAGLGLVLVAGANAAQAQTTIVAPAVTVVQTTETVRTVRPIHPRVVRRVVTTRTVTRQVVPASSVIARTVGPQPLYDEVAPPLGVQTNYQPPLYDTYYQPRLYDAYQPPLYDQVTPVTAVSTPILAGSAVATQPFIYRYVYEPDRILVIDPTTNITVQALPR